MTKLRIINIICRGDKNTRYLAIDDETGNYYSIKTKNGSYSVGDYTEQESAQKAKDSWVKEYNKTACPSYNYKTLIKHLIDYKKGFLLDNNKGFFRGVPYDHVFSDPRHNLIQGKFGKCLDMVYNNLKERGEIHEGFANMNSSQAFAINFLAPLVKLNLLSIIGIQAIDVSYETCIFEKVIDNSEETQFDFFVDATKLQPNYSIEVKYTEQDFGITNMNPPHLEKYTCTYRDVLKELTIESISEETFFKKYQLWRNLLYIIKGKSEQGFQHVFFMFPEFRCNDLGKSVEEAKALCKEKYRNYIHTIIVDDVAKMLIESDNEDISNYYLEFKKKYLDF